MAQANTYRAGPDEAGHFGIFGGRFVAETLMPLILEVERAYRDAKADPAFRAELDDLLAQYAGRPSPLYFARRLTAQFATGDRGARIRSEEHTSELQSLMRISYAVFCLQKKNTQ